MPWLNPETKKPGGLEPTGPYSLTSPAVPLAFAYQGQTSEPASPLKGAWMVSTFYGGGHSGVTSPEIPAENHGLERPAAPLFLTADGSRESHAATLSDGRKNRSRHAGRPYRGISWSEILQRADKPTAVEKDDAPFVIPSTYRESEARTHAVQRERGEFWFLALDIDTGSPSLEQVVAAVAAVTGGARAVFYSSSSAAPDCLKWRGLIPLAAPVSGADYADTQTALFDLLKRQGITCDPALSRAAQPVYLPNVPPARRGADGRPLFYRSLRADGPLLDLTAGSGIVEARDALRATRERAREARAADAAARRQARIDATGNDFDPVQFFNQQHTVASCFSSYGFKQKPGTDDYRSPFPGSSRYATRDMGDHWVCLSSWAKDHDVGRESKNGHRYGSAFDLFAAFEHGGDRRAAIVAYLTELGLRADGLDDVEPVVVETLPDRGPVRDLAEWRQEVAVERALALRMPGLHLDRSPTGSGKTYATTRAIVEAVETTRREAEFDDSVVPITRTLTVLPDHANIRERVREMREAGLDAAAYPARDETTCGNLEAVRRAEGLGLTAGATICAAPCPFFDSCLYNREFKQAEQAAHAVATHERLRLSPGSLTKDRQVIVIDETPEQVLAPSITVRVDDFNPVIVLASAVKDDYLFRYGRPMEPTAEERAFAATLTAAHALIVEAAEAATEPGVVEIPLPPPAEVPKNWQKTLLKWANETGVYPSHDRHKQERFRKAIRLLTMIVTGKLDRLHLLVDETSRHEKQADGSVREWNPLHHFVVGTWKTKLPYDSVPVICLDATATADDLRAATGREVRDCTPEGYLPNVAPVVQIPWDVTAGQSPKAAAGFLEAFLNSHPEFERVGLIGHQDQVKAMMADDDVLPARLRARVAKSCWFGAGPDRASNDWHDACDALLIIGTMRPGGGPVKQRLVSHGKYDAARRGSDWGVRHWAATTTDGRPYQGEGKGYLDPEWHQAHAAISRAAVHQAAGRGRAITDRGIPVWIVSDEPMGCPVDDSLEAVSHEVRETVEAVRVVRDGGAGTELHPIRDTYRAEFGSRTAVRVSAVIDYIRSAVPGRHGKPLGLRAVEKRLALALKHGRLERPAKGWLIVAGDEPATVPEQVVGPPAMVSRTEPAVVITATGPATVDTVLEVAALPTPETTTSVSTATAPPDPAPLVTALVDETDERAAIMEFDGHLDAATADRLARETVMGRNVVSPVAPAEPVGVDHVALAARLHPFVDAAVQRFGGPVRVISPEEDPFSTGWGVRATAAARPEGIVCRCGSREVVEVWFHDGQSSRDDCANCGKFVRHTRWHGKPVGPPVVVPPVQADEPPSSPNRLSFLVPIPAAMLVGAVE